MRIKPGLHTDHLPGSTPTLKPCRKCKSTNIKMKDCGYSSFNVGHVTCQDCGHDIELNPCGCFPNGELANAWNKDAPDDLEAAQIKIKKLQKKLREVKKDRDELQHTFDLQWKVSMKAIKVWQKAHPGNDLVWPDLTKMLNWFIEKAK